MATHDAAKMAAAKLIVCCFDARTTAHLLHLQTRSYEAHVALDGFYSDIVDLVDSFAEAFQGVYGIIERYPKPEGYDPKKDYQFGVKLLVELRREITSLRSAIPGSELQNSIDEIVALIDRSAYKLRFLK
jgi:hypothetical protein